MDARVLAIDIGGTKIAAAVVDPDGGVTHKHIVATPATQGARAILEAAIAAGRYARDVASSEGLKVVALGVGTAGHVDRRRGAISYASGTLPGWTGVELVRELRAAFALPVSVENDVNAMALGETQFGAGRQWEDALYITVGTGVGGAVVSDRRLLRGATWTAGEVGHLVVDWNGDRRCSCGQPGHLEAYTSGPAIAERYRELASLDTASDLHVVAERARDGDAVAAQAIVEGAQILGLALGGLLNVLDPQALIVGGGVAELGDIWWQPLEAALRANPMPGPARIPVQRALLGVDAVLIGAAWLALREAGG